MDEVLKMIDELPESSVYGPEFDKLFAQLSAQTTVLKLLEIEIEDYHGKLRALRDMIDSITKFRVSTLIAYIRTIPALAQWGDFV